MRVLHVGAYCTHGGVETIIATLIGEQKKTGIEAEAFYFVNLGGARNYEGLCRVRFAENHSLTSILMSEDYDVLHVVADASASASKCIKRSLYRGAVVVTCHGAFSGSLESDYVTAVSEFTASKIKNKCSKPVYVVYNGIDLTQFHPAEAQPDEKPVIAWIGRSNDPFKDVSGLAALANSEIADKFRFAVVDGSHLDDSIATWLPDDAIAIKRKAWQEMPDFYRWVTSSGGFLLSTSRLEACPLNLLEAQACGCPVIAPRVGGIPEIVQHQVTGCLYNRSDGMRSIKEAIRWLYSGDHYAQASKTAPEYVKQNYSAEEMNRSYKDIYQAAMKHSYSGLGNKLARKALSVSIAPLKAIIRRGDAKE